LNVDGRDILIDVDDTLRQNEAIEIGKKAREGLSHREAHQPNLEVAQKGLNGCRLRHANDPDDVHRAIV